MFKMGLFKKEQLTPANLAGFPNSHKFIALDLYNALDDLPWAEIDQIQERMLHWFRLQNGVLKRTHARRFVEFDRLSLSAIAANFSSGQNLRVHDIGASDGRFSRRHSRPGNVSNSPSKLRTGSTRPRRDREEGRTIGPRGSESSPRFQTLRYGRHRRSP